MNAGTPARPVSFTYGELVKRAHALSPGDVRTAGHQARAFDAANLYGDHAIEPRLAPAPLYQPAAVLIPVINRDDALSVVLTQRADFLAQHPGQIAFPGGKIDQEDATAADAALREAHEEITLLPHQVRVIGTLNPYLSGSGYHITAVIGVVDAAASFQPNPHEVADIFEVPFAHLMAKGRLRQEIRPFRDFQRAIYSITYQDRYIWGITAGLIRHLQTTLFPEFT